ncbi:MAG: ATP-binding protein [Butyrivibrio sp.]|nr:ATP-binding protein [Butyrivibrio sp.]
MMIGRAREIDILDSCLHSGRPEFIVVFGRRRVGKTFLIREYFGDRFSFYATGVAGVRTKEQLKIFHQALKEYGSAETAAPKDWFEAFARLKALLQQDKIRRDASSGRRVLFLDELPWMDSAKSDFKSALDYFWNSWASAQKDIMLIVCGSATSWIIGNILTDRGGFYNRVTRRIHLGPFTLQECEALFDQNHIVLTRKQIIECYMVFGGIPYYLNLFDRRLSLAQNIDELIFSTYGELHHEYEELFQSLFKHAEKHYAIIQALADKRMGITRTELSSHPEIGDGEPLTKALSELEESGFIRKYQGHPRQKQGFLYQLTDPFILFSLVFLKEKNLHSWQSFLHTPDYYAWRGNAFEIVCLNHVQAIKAKLGISGVETSEYAWRSKKISPGAQIDLLIDRRDGIINLCEMKYTDEAFTIDQAYESQLMHKREVFRQEMQPDKALHITLITVSGLAKNNRNDIVQQVLNGEALFL